ncbi:MAG: NAD-dependent epimerase/dehydratase family protein [Lysobacter sp.]|nr:NAD-dependent epimerase/dehydratase family protein [Lysobacter sp.]
MTSQASRKLRVAVVGAGYVATHHLAALSQLDFVEIVGLCDSNRVAAEALAARFKVGQVAASLAELADATPNVVYVLTPPASHATLAIQAMDMGCHVLVEKPMADSAADCEAMLAKAKATGLTLGVNHSDLFDPVLMQALDTAKSGAIGDVLSVDIIRNSEYPPYAGGPLPGQVKQGSYPFRDLGVHGFYTIEAFLGPIAQAEVQYQSRGADPNLGFDEWQARAQTATGVGRLLLSWNARPMENRLFVRGTKGTIEVDRFTQTCRVHRVLPGPKFIGILLNAFFSAVKDSVRIPLNVLRFATGRLKPSPGIRMGAEAFARAVHRGEAPPFTAEDGLRIARLLDPLCAEPDHQRLAQLEARYTALPPADALVTGAAGFLGKAVVAALRAQGRTVRVLVRRPVAAYRDDEGMQTVIGDLGDPRIVDHAVAGAAVVYHVGAAMRGGPRDFEAGTIWGTRNVLDACRKHATTRLVYVSSMSVFDHAGRRSGDVLTEDYRFEPHPQLRGAYTQTKLTAEQMVADAIVKEHLPAVILRPGQIFGPGAEQVTPNGTIALAGRWIAIGSGAQALPLVYRDDTVDALLLAGTSLQALGRIFNLVDTDSVDRGTYLRRCKAKLGTSLKLMWMPEWVFMCLAIGVELLGKALKRDVPLTRYRVRSLRPLANFDTTAAREVLGWTPRIGVKRGLDITFGAER